jgi:hypothetical protein
LGHAAQETMRRFTWARTVRGVEAACASALRRVGREANLSSEQSVQPLEADRTDSGTIENARAVARKS